MDTRNLPNGPANPKQELLSEHTTNGFREPPNDREKRAPVTLWRHPKPESTPMWAFLTKINSNYGLNLRNYEELHRWSTENIAAFWEETWHHVGIRASQPYERVVDESAPMFPRPPFFPGAKLNFAENLLFPTADVDPDSPAMVAATELDRETVTWKELRERVRRCQAGLIALGLGEGDRVAAYVANHANAVVAMLATTSLGCIWTAISPDTGVHAVLERLRQIEPDVLFADEATFYNGKWHGVMGKLGEIVAGLPSLRAVIVFSTNGAAGIDKESIKPASGQAYDYASFTRLGSQSPMRFAQLPADHPVYILYSSGTTGAPKCIVHSSIGTLIQHKKEHVLHCSIGPGSRFFYYTTCTWMMWHWLVSGLACGATIILYDGSPFRCASGTGTEKSSSPDNLAMPRLIDELQITHFGTSAKYLSVLEQKNIRPLPTLSLSSLEAIYSTGSPLAPSTFEYVYSAFPPSLNLGSITGGTDIISLFGAPNPLVPVYPGEIQQLGLGMAVRAWDHTGADVTLSGQPGDLVCIRPFPCQPVRFWGPDGDAKYRASYFETFPAVWHHGDFVRFNPTTGGLVMLGRSDGVLKPAGVRFGSAEIYNVLLQQFPGRIADALCVGRRRETDVDETVVLFVKMEPGVGEGEGFSEELVREIKAEIKLALSARHVPGIVDECPEIPVTANGKKVESAVKQILCGLNVKTSASVANAECLEWYRRWAETHP